MIHEVPQPPPPSPLLSLNFKNTVSVIPNTSTPHKTDSPGPFCLLETVSASLWLVARGHLEVSRQTPPGAANGQCQRLRSPGRCRLCPPAINHTSISDHQTLILSTLDRGKGRGDRRFVWSAVCVCDVCVCDVCDVCVCDVF